MNRLPNSVIPLFGRQYDLAFGRSQHGGTWLLLVNRQTEAALPITDLGSNPGLLNQVMVTDVDGIVPALEEAGILRRIADAKACDTDLPMCRCEILHAGLIQVLAAVETDRSNRSERAEPTLDMER